MKNNIDFEKISSELQNRIDFVIEQASKQQDVNIKSCVEAANISKLVCTYALELYTEELFSLLSYLPHNSEK